MYTYNIFSQYSAATSRQRYSQHTFSESSELYLIDIANEWRVDFWEFIPVLPPLDILPSPPPPALSVHILYTHTHTHTRTHTHTHIYTHTQAIQELDSASVLLQPDEYTHTHIHTYDVATLPVAISRILPHRHTHTCKYTYLCTFV